MKIDLQILKNKLHTFPVWCLQNSIVPILVRIGEFISLNPAEDNNTHF